MNTFKKNKDKAIGVITGLIINDFWNHFDKVIAGLITIVIISCNLLGNFMHGLIINIIAISFVWIAWFFHAKSKKFIKETKDLNNKINEYMINDDLFQIKWSRPNAQAICPEHLIALSCINVDPGKYVCPKCPENYIHNLTHRGIPISSVEAFNTVRNIQNKTLDE